MNQTKQHIIRILFVFPLSLLGLLVVAQPYRASLDVDWEDGSTVVEGLFSNQTQRTLNLNFQLIVEQKSKNGNVTNNRQSGSFQILPQREKLVSLIRLNVDELDFYRIYFKIYKKGKVIAEDYIVKWENLGLDLSDREKKSNEEKKQSTLSIINTNNASAEIGFYNQKEVDKKKETKPLVPKKMPVPKQPHTSSDPNKVSTKPVLPKPNPTLKAMDKKQDKKQTYTTPSVKTERKLDDFSTIDQNATSEGKRINEEKERTDRQQATKKLLADLIEQQAAKKETTQAPISQKETTDVSSEDVEFGGLIFDDTRTKTGRDFYDIFYSNYIAPKGAENFNITIKELPGRGRMAQVAVLVNDNQVLLRLLQPRASLVEDQAIQSVYAIEGYLKNATQLKKQLESADQQGSGIF